MATKSEVDQALIERINDLIATGDAKALVYLAKALEGTGDGTTVQNLLTAQGDMIIRGATGLEVIKIADMLAPYQDVLESGVNIKTINGINLLGGGNIEIESGSGTILTKPNYDEVLFIKVNPHTLNIPIGTITEFTEVTEAVSLDLDTADLVGSTKIAGTDYYVYSKADGTFYLSADKTIIVDRLIGGFHYGLIPEDEALTGNKTEADMVNIRGINSYSFWDLKFKAIAGNDGMVLVGTKWYDIYLLNSEHIDNGTSKANATIAAGATGYGRAIPKIPLAYGGDNTLTYGAFKWFHATEIGKSHGKELISWEEFMTIAYGVTEGKSSSTDGYESVAGKVEHYSNLTSKFGIEQASGVEYIWGADLSKREDGAGSWKNVLEGRGQMYSYGTYNQVAVLLGGGRGYGVNAGSRSSYWNNYVWYSSWDVGCRIACDHLKLV